MANTILTNAQRTILRSITEHEYFRQFYLSGGTALAEYYLHHRLSEDLDFFCRTSFDPLFLHSWVEQMRTQFNCSIVNFNKIADRYQFVFHLDDGELLKIEFVQYAFDQIEGPSVQEGIRIDSLRDISANKLMALLDRFEPKDFVDLFFLIKRIPFDQIKTDFKRKFGMPTDPIFLGTEFLKVRRIAALPRMIVPLTIQELKEFFLDHARMLGGEIITN